MKNKIYNIKINNDFPTVIWIKNSVLYLYCPWKSLRRENGVNLLNLLPLNGVEFGRDKVC